MLRLNMECQSNSLKDLGAKIYTVPAPSQDGTSWEPFTDEKDIHTMAEAINILSTQIANSRTCDDYFGQLPKKRLLSDMVNGKTEKFSISYDPWGPAAGETVGLHITIGRTPLRVGRWAVAATLVHELAHANGATDKDGQAEKALLACGLRQHYIHSNAVKGK